MTAAMTAKLNFVSAMIVYYVVIGGLELAVIRYSQSPWMAAVAAVGVWIISPLTYYGVRKLVERGTFVWSDQAWSFRSDAVLIAGLAALAALMWQHLPEGRVPLWPAWILGGLVLGVAFGYAFHFIMDKAVYREAGAELQWDSPTKWLHDLGLTPTLVTVLVSTVLPGLIYSDWGVRGIWSGQLWPAVVPITAVLCFLGWLAILITEHPDPFKLHPAYVWG